MSQSKNPAAGKRQGFCISVGSDNATYTAATLSNQQPIDLVAILAARSGVSGASIRAQLDAWRIGGAR